MLIQIPSPPIAPDLQAYPANPRHRPTYPDCTFVRRIAAGTGAYPPNKEFAAPMSVAATSPLLTILTAPNPPQPAERS